MPTSPRKRCETHATAEVDGLVRLAAAHPGTLIVVSNEVGMGMHPDYPLGRIYRDAFGRANQRIAAHADAAYFLLAGIPLDLTRLRAALPVASPHGTDRGDIARRALLAFPLRVILCNTGQYWRNGCVSCMPGV